MKLMLVEDLPTYRARLAEVLRRNYEVVEAGSLEESQVRYAPDTAVVLLDIRLDESNPDNRDGLVVLKWLMDQPDPPLVIVMTAYASVDVAVEAMKLGASDFLTKPVHLGHLEQVLNKATESRQLRQRVDHLQRRVDRHEPWRLVGSSPAIERVRDYVERAGRDGKISVLILGESGTGKEMAARCVHRLGRRSKGPFVVRSLTDVPSGTLASELFGHEPGAFTGAEKRRSGLFEQADGGVLFLDEIGDLDRDLQASLLRVIESGQYRRVGANQDERTDVQLVTATNRDVRAMVTKGEFRDDLYQRLKGLVVELPPLRDRQDDILELAQHLLERAQRDRSTRVRGFAPEVLDAFQRYRWPGNVRELLFCTERALLFAEGEHIELSHLPPEISGETATGMDAPVELPEGGISLDRVLASHELGYLQAALQKVSGRKGDAWALAGLNDRHAFRRRVVDLLGRYPDLRARFPYLAKSYQRSLEA